MRFWCFTKRNLKEILRDPLSYVFCLGFPVVMLIIFQILNYYTTEELYWFRIDFLTPGIAIFSLSFVMLYTALIVSKDRVSSLLTRLYAGPMRTVDYILGYVIPGLIIGILQLIVCLLSAAIIGAITGVSLSFTGAILLILSQLPAVLFFTSLGVFFGSLLSDKSAPGISSVVISAAGFLSGAWMPLETMGGFETVCRFFPFYPSTLLGRAAYTPDFASEQVLWSIVTVVAYTVLTFALATVVFYHKKSGDNK